jgi:geranylgeranyl pyrophosphate synthase
MDNLVYKKALEFELQKIIPKCILTNELNYAIFGGGKNFRAILCYQISNIFNAPIIQAHSSAMALELIHTYSLVHDDLPAMDDDDLRRGKPTLHKQFDEASAILIGDGLQTLAFKTLADDKNLDAITQVKLIQILSKASFEMVLGQKIDIDNNAKTLEELTNLHNLKTGALLTASLLMGAIVARVGENDYLLLENIGKTIGLAYQVQDDVLDLLGSEQTGKNSSDAINNKTTFVSLLGKDGAQNYYAELYNQALSAVNNLSVDANLLATTIKIMQNRNF